MNEDVSNPLKRVVLHCYVGLPEGKSIELTLPCFVHSGVSRCLKRWNCQLHSFLPVSVLQIQSAKSVEKHVEATIASNPQRLQEKNTKNSSFLLGGIFSASKFVANLASTGVRKNTENHAA